jgi:hypothetical protein
VLAALKLQLILKLRGLGKLGSYAVFRSADDENQFDNAGFKRLFNGLWN